MIAGIFTRAILSEKFRIYIFQERAFLGTLTNSTQKQLRQLFFTDIIKKVASCLRASGFLCDYNIHISGSQFVSKKDDMNGETLWLQNAVQIQGCY